jgi:hypothetical protein
MSIVIANVEVAIAELLSGSFLSAKRGLLQINHRPDGFRHNDVAVSVNEFHAIRSACQLL